MKNALKHSHLKFTLIAKIKGLASESRHARMSLLKTKTKEAKYDIIGRKNNLGWDTRNHLLAYAFLRGLSYKSIEKTCADENLPNAAKIHNVVIAHAPNFIPYDSITKEGGGIFRPTLEDVTAWLGTK